MFRDNWSKWIIRLSSWAEWILSFVQEILGLQGPISQELVPPCKFSTWVSWSVKHRLVLHLNWWHKIRILFRNNWTACMCWMDLELCTGDIGCKNWPTRELVPPCKFSSWVSGSVKHRLVLLVHPILPHKIKKLVLEKPDCLHGLNGSWALHRRWV